MNGGHARGKSRCDQFSAVISWTTMIISMPCWGGWVRGRPGEAQMDAGQKGLS